MLLTSLLVFAAVTQSPRQMIAPRIGEPAPAFAATGADGKKYSLSDFPGKFVVLEWTNKDCPFVRKHYKGNMQATQEKAEKLGAVWLSVCSSAPGKQGYLTGDEQLAHLKEVNSKALTILLDPDGKLGRLYAARTTPQVAIVDPSGKLIYNGAIDDKPTPDVEDLKTAKNYVLAALEEAMAGKPVTVDTTRPYGCSVKYAE